MRVGECVNWPSVKLKAQRIKRQKKNERQAAKRVSTSEEKRQALKRVVLIKECG